MFSKPAFRVSDLVLGFGIGWRIFRDTRSVSRSVFALTL